MNRIFKVLWNAATGTFVVTSETAKSRGKKNGRRKLAVSALIGLSSIMVSADALANAGNDTGDGVTPTGTQTGGKGWIAIGTDATANTYTNVDGASAAMGYKASAMGKWSTAIGSYSQSTGDSSLALGVKSVSAGDRAIAMGASSSASGSYSMAMGVYANSSGAKSVALGYKSVASGATSSALGYQATASGDDSAAFGNGAKAVGTNSVALGSGSIAQEDNSVAVGNSTTQRQITYVAKGDINSTSTDAVTGAQIYSLSQSVADRLGGGASVNSDGTVNAPLYEVGTGIYNNVGSALSALNTSITNTEASVAGLAEDALLWDDSTSAFSASHTGNASKITNLAAGTLAADSTDAVNGSQLFDTNEKVDQNTTDIATNTTNINSLSDSVTTLTDDALLWDAASGAFSAKHNGNDSKITNLAAGTLAADSTDAVNGSQLFDTNEKVDQNTADITTNTNSINQNTTDIATNTTNINNLSDSITTLTDDALLWDAASGTFSASRSGSASKITNLAAGTLAADSTDAVNGSQLYETNQRVDQNTSAIADINTSITNLSSDNLSWNETTSSFSASHGSSTTNKITNVAAGELSEESTDAVNGSQLFETNEKVDQNTTDIAANTTNITQNSTAIENLNTSVSDINTSITGLTDNALLWDEDIGAFSANHGGSTSKITNVAAGALSEDSTDAVNGSQLYETNQKVDQNTSAIADINTSITNLGTDALSWDDEEGAFSASHGTSGTNKITNVAAGEIASDSTDAVNGSQLYETNMLISQYSESISQLAGDTSETYITENGTGVKYIRTNDNGLEGQDAYATGNGATAVGYDAVASGAGSLALGQNSSSSIEGSIALGSGSTSNRAITTGIRETSATSDGVVIGYNTTDRELLGALSLGTDGESYRQITNVADGSEAQDAVTVRQLQNAIGAVTTTPTKYYHANSTEEDSLAVGTDSLAMGAKTIVNADAGIGIGLNTLVMADAINGIAIGSNARANHANSIAMGNGSQTTRGAQTDYTAYNMDTPQNSVGEFSVGSEDGQRQITNVAAGSADTDAVNVSQLKVTDAQVSRNTQSITNLNTQVSNLDTRVTNIENGIGDIVTTGSTKYFKTNTDGADANAQGADSVAIGSGSIAAAENSVALGTNSVADEANTVSVGSSTQQRRITNVAAGVNNTDAVNVAQLKASEAGSVRYETNADGSVNYSVLNLGDGSGGTTRIGNVSAAVNDTDAVNYAQLKRSVEEANTYTDQKMGEMNSKIKGVENKMSGGIASAMAMAGLPQAYAPGANMTSIAGGTFNGESAVAIGVSMVSESGGWVYKLQGTSNSQGDYSAAIGAGFQW
ncbi:TPA: trimeric autotransporter adhesin SadA [Salmonella enterica]|uniref:trimeric autotransporter adhesin SadA n=1 Tax=Salmonella enterica TaxID=28901 RepID=UPI001270B6CF|nr:trimeric autotransporter adhesin SadA [Salmonella enterica]ECI4582651.1 autotransporter adhesin SadA [Salmonella enterica subsp. enterica]ECI4691500.1 autotransporter adhesin SadA [Salmonella enterica subsp. enterica]ECJ1110798.1 autotransporter adhesin SadA [Salmonella enterica subsp. enterica serovar Gallinarum]MBD8281619.1 trimeric autotransporter adhesin SadA [Salmonella enterica subsp. enterica serovar Gallinarum]HBX1352766.1 trimeric autotransporter adhesin SadA [Salmonella enterica]